MTTIDSSDSDRDVLLPRELSLEYLECETEAEIITQHTHTHTMQEMDMVHGTTIKHGWSPAHIER